MRGILSGVCAIAAALLLTPGSAEAKGWKTKNVQATICADGQPFWGTPRTAGFPRNVLCNAYFATTITAEVAYNGKQAWSRFVSPSRMYSGPVRNKITWYGTWNNGAKPPEKFMNVGADGEISGGAKFSLGVNVKYFNASVESELKALRSYWLRIDVTPKGKVKLRGGTNTGVIAIRGVSSKNARV